MLYPKHILLCNDDGFDAHGIQALEEDLRSIGELWKIAPDSERSGCSHALNFHSNLHLIQVGQRSFRIKNAYPADCSNVGLHAADFPPFDLIVAGINHGPNLGDDVHYSGTVAAARQGSIHQVRSVAISAVDREADLQQMRRIAKWLRAWLCTYFSFLDPHITYSINYPLEKSKTASAMEETPFPPVRYCYQGKRRYKDRYIEEAAQGQAPSRKLRLESQTDYDTQANSDFDAISQGCIAITPLSRSITDLVELEKWERQAKQARIIQRSS